MENEIKLNGTVLAEDDSAGTEEDPITSLIRAKYIDPSGKIHFAVLQTLLSAVVDDDGKRLDRIIKELQDAVGTGGKPVTEIINTEIDKKVGNLSDLKTNAKDSVVNAVNEINHGLDEKLQYVPVVADVTQNPETYETGYIYSVEGAVSEENGHPYTISWKHITYLVFGDEKGKNGYKNILALDNDGNIYNKSQLWDADRWSDWEKVLNRKDFSENISNENLAYNPDFQIKQRNITSFTTSKDIVNGDYFPDRWRCNRDYNDAGLTYTIKTDGLHCKFNSKSGSYGHITQVIDSKDAIPLSGKTITFSAHCSVSSGDGHGGIRNLIIYKGNYSNLEKLYQTNFDDLKEGLHAITFTLPAITDMLMFAIHFSHDTDNGEVVLNWVKIEEGSQSTKFVHPDYTTELLRCKRYFQKLGGWWKYMSAGFVKRATKVASFPLVVGTTSMRVTPTLTISNKENIKVIGGNINTDIVDLEGFQHASENYYSISFTLPENLEVERVNEMVLLYFGENVELQFDAEIY